MGMEMVNMVGSLSFVTFLLACVWPTFISAAGCPNLRPVPIDENFLFNGQPPDGFYATYSSGEQSVPNYIRKAMNKKGISGPSKACLTLKMKVSGKDLVTAPPIECSYKSVSALYCNSEVKGPAAAALTSVGIQTPSATVQVIVDTDNRTYLATGLCADGAYYEWAIFTTSPGNKSLRSRTAAALSLSLADIRAAARKRFQFSRI